MVTPPRTYGSAITDSTRLHPESPDCIFTLRVRDGFYSARSFLPLLIHTVIHSPPFYSFPALPAIPSLGLRCRRSLHSLDLHPTAGNSISHTGSGRSDLSLSILPSLSSITLPGPVIRLLLAQHVPWPPFIDIPFQYVAPPSSYLPIFTTQRTYTYVLRAMNSKYGFPS
jgi:hypothetical protein